LIVIVFLLLSGWTFAEEQGKAGAGGGGRQMSADGVVKTGVEHDTAARCVRRARNGPRNP
jgi:hypothetical protein